MITVMMRFILLMILGLASISPAVAQKERKFIREGNTLFDNQDFEKAEVEYRKAAEKDDKSFEAAFNMADALYKQKKHEEALEQFTALSKQVTDKNRLGEIYHNIGNTLLAMEKTEESVEAYKESLRNRPTAESTKYNLEYARHKQQQEQEQEKKDDQEKNEDNKDQEKKDDQKDNKDEKKDEQDQKDKQDDKKDQEKDKQDKQDKKEEQEQQQQEGKISKEDAERLLEALQNDEKGVQEKVQKQKVEAQKARRLKIDKNW